MGKQKYTDEQIIKALRASKGLVYLAAKRVGCDPDTVHLRARRSAAVAACLKDARGEIVDVAEDRLFKAVSRGDPWAVAMVLKTLGKDRGYVERSEQSVAGEVNLNHASKDTLPPTAAVLALLEHLGVPRGGAAVALPADGALEPPRPAPADGQAGAVPPAR